MADIEIKSFTAADRDWLVAQHEVLYARDEGFDGTFGPLVAGILDEFLATNDPACEAGWIAWDGERRLGSIFCVRLDEATAKLRLLLLVPEARGKGLGLRLLRQCMGFAKDRGYEGMQLWTHQEHRAAGALYAKNGWECVDERPVTSFGKHLIEQTWVISF
ncbi:GNAT family N-acetyltransferase [Sulfitobacter aestuariivivens]|uniref:GNAT family N-acetyltransferase n=1 Tax=Sulfitobacter aestuariivivens TaxID=2766981 RepID=A0A927HCG4_9RHOB|nr:GNAT family N-acetyltransferase [Sulfitobacter aestuariivivens]MBD3662542.1 GNAT family N-acetyltransferase [Sulfitobacter aestuariivivens]